MQHTGRLLRSVVGRCLPVGVVSVRDDRKCGAHLDLANGGCVGILRVLLSHFVHQEVHLVAEETRRRTGTGTEPTGTKRNVSFLHVEIESGFLLLKYLLHHSPELAIIVSDCSRTHHRMLPMLVNQDRRATRMRYCFRSSMQLRSPRWTS